MNNYMTGLVYDKKTDFMIGRKYEIVDEGVVIDLSGVKVGKKLIINLEEKFGQKIYIATISYDGITWIKKDENGNIELKGVLDVL